MTFRMVLYYPVSALVTLFANILQNPSDSRARSDLKLMNHVVNFLGMLTKEGPNVAVRRMLTICSEFERISRIVLDKHDRESSSRRKRKQHDPSSNRPASESQQSSPPPYKATTPMPSQPGNIPNVFSPPSAINTEVCHPRMSWLNGSLTMSRSI